MSGTPQSTHQAHNPPSFPHSSHASPAYQPPSITRNCNSRTKRKQTQRQLAKFELDARFAILHLRFATLDSIRYDSLRARFILPHQQVEIAFAICFIIYSSRIIFDQAAERAPQETASAAAPLHRRLSKCNSAAASAAVNPCHKSAAPGCTKEARENSITESKTGRKLKIKICPNNLQGERKKKRKECDAEKKRREPLEARLFVLTICYAANWLSSWLLGRPLLCKE